jgi:exopolysaccharide biosynthesis WecB/TagA/CpsF family protein
MAKPQFNPGDGYAQESPMGHWPTTLLGGLPIVRCSMDEAAQGFVEQALLHRGTNARPFYSTSANGQVIALCAKNSDFQNLMLEADQIHADGMPMIMYSRTFSSQPVSERIATTDLVHSVAAKAERAGVSFYFLGGTEEVNAKAVSEMRAKYPNLTFAGRRNGYFNRAEEDAVIADIQASKPDILWVGLGFPLEQAFVSRNIDRLRSVGVVKTSGGLFDFVSGKNARAPQWMQRYGLEWAYRMYNEPRRLTKRYLLSNPAAIRALFTHSN